MNSGILFLIFVILFNLSLLVAFRIKTWDWKKWLAIGLVFAFGLLTISAGFEAAENIIEWIQRTKTIEQGLVVQDRDPGPPFL